MPASSAVATRRGHWRRCVRGGLFQRPVPAVPPAFAAMRGSSPGSLRLVSPARTLARPSGRANAAGCPARRSRARCASSGSDCASRRICSARSKVIAPPKPSLKPRSRKPCGLLLAAVEGMRDAARHLDAPQVLEQGVGRAPHVQDHRQLELACQLELRARRTAPGACGRGRARSGRGRFRRPPRAAGRRDAEGDARARCRSHRPLRDARRADGGRARRHSPCRCASSRTASKLPVVTPGITIISTPRASARAITAPRSASNSPASRWQCVSIHI